MRGVAARRMVGRSRNSATATKPDAVVGARLRAVLAANRKVEIPAAKPAPVVNRALPPISNFISPKAAIKLSAETTSKRPSGACVGASPAEGRSVKKTHT
jgi:hypothetical protein